MSMFLLRDLPTSETLQRHSQRYPWVDPAALESCISLLVVARDVINALDSHLSRHNLSQGRFNVLLLLNRNPDSSLCPADLADRSGVTRATMTGLLDGLEKDSLIQRIQDREDRRRLGIVLTPKGREFIDGLMPEHFYRIAQLMANLSDEEREQLRGLLDKVADGLPALSEPYPPVTVN
jgi:DNA-binding MarR family transcriptional regulator